MNQACLATVVMTIALFGTTGRAAEPMSTADNVRTAIAKSILLLEKGSKGSIEQRKQCFNCHNQGLPMMALELARTRGFDVDAENLKQQLQFTANFLGRNKDQYRKGAGQGGQVDTAGFALWALDNGGWKPDDTTEAVIEYLLQRQSDRPHYRPESNRPPSEQSYFTSSYVGLRGLKVYGIPEQQDRIKARIDQVRGWLLETPGMDTEDRVFRLHSLRLVTAPDDALQQAAEQLKAMQREDGGWSQLPDMTSDAYATGTALVALHEAGGLSTDDSAYRKGLSYLISTQEEDGSWHVRTRAEPFQTYFESGYPHGKDQFISIAAAGWSTTALILSLPKQP